MESAGSMSQLILHRALWEIPYQLRTEHLSPVAPMRRAIAHSVLSNTLWRSEIGRVEDIDSAFYKSRTALAHGDMVRHHASTMIWSEDRIDFYRSCVSMFDEKIFTLDGAYSVNARENFLAIAAPHVMRCWKSGIVLTGMEIRSLRHTFPWIADIPTDNALCNWFAKQVPST